MTVFSRCDLTFMCRQTWNDLPVTDSAHIRYCGTCEKGVFPVRTRAQFEAASAVGRCVALTDDNEIVGWIGESGFDWMAEQSETVEFRIPHPLDAAAQSRLRLAFPKLENPKGGWQADTWIAIGTFSAQVAEVLTKDTLAQFPDFEVRMRCGEDLG
ncbi:hypothetical protein [Massilia aquatica]|uniref:Uncharacterized protein n=1 Tax=Massilia aquatica TaxID=2609000 RepID=A0ABX0M9S5_9BURK|nr:hypothetical protein [Massilia aquatica]NHZ43919.1 hypothetical protein [Massilia aquatica]